MHKYEIIIYWSNEDRVFIAEVPELPGCMTHGDTQAEALANANEAIQLWVDTAKEFGDPVPQPRGERTTSRIYTAARDGRRSNPRKSLYASPPRSIMNPKAHQ